jgi:hypothetical protein
VPRLRQSGLRRSRYGGGRAIRACAAREPPGPGSARLLNLKALAAPAWVTAAFAATPRQPRRWLNLAHTKTLYRCMRQCHLVVTSSGCHRAVPRLLDVRFQSRFAPGPAVGRLLGDSCRGFGPSWWTALQRSFAVNASSAP